MDEKINNILERALTSSKEFVKCSLFLKGKLYEREELLEMLIAACKIKGKVLKISEDCYMISTGDIAIVVEFYRMAVLVSEKTKELEIA